MIASMLSMLMLVVPQTAPPPPASPPRSASTPPMVPQDDVARSDDIVVTGLKDLDAPDSAVTHATLGSGKVGSGAVASRTTYGLASRFARCVLSRKSDHRLLRDALDGRINGARQAFAQGRLVQANVSCAQDARAVLSITDTKDVRATFVPGYDGSYYDRGALFIETLRAFAPDLRLTAKQTADPAIQARFNAREESLARFRLPVDRQYFETAICLVRLQPALSVQLVKTDKFDAITRIEAAIVNRARECVGGAKKAYFDPSQFRFYIADAVYRWAVAAKGVDSLIPTS